MAAAAVERCRKKQLHPFLLLLINCRGIPVFKTVIRAVKSYNRFDEAADAILYVLYSDGCITEYFFELIFIKRIGVDPAQYHLLIPLDAHLYRVVAHHGVVHLFFGKVQGAVGSSEVPQENDIDQWPCIALVQIAQCTNAACIAIGKRELRRMAAGAGFCIVY